MSKLQKMTALVIDGRGDAHWVTMNGNDAKSLAENAMDELASDFIYDDAGEDLEGEDNEPDESEIQIWKDDCRLVRVWAGEHTSVPTEAALYEDGDWPELPAVGTVIEIGSGKVEVLANLPEGFKNWQNNPFLIPVKVLSADSRMRKKPNGFTTWPHGDGLMVTADAI